MSAGPQRLQVLTLNLWNLNGRVRQRLEDLAATLRRWRPDVVAFQEVSLLEGRDQARIVAEAAGYAHVHYDRAWRGAGREEGLAVVSDLPLTPLAATPLPTAARDQARLLQRVGLELERRTVVIANTHLAWRRRHTNVRARQAARIRDVLAATEAQRLLVGDLNDVVASTALHVLTTAPPDGAGLVDAFRAAGCPDRATVSLRNPHARGAVLRVGRRVDHVLVDRSLRVSHAEVVLTGRDAPVVSDHFGVLATVDPAPGTASGA